jgi:HK97 family phage major capsid protein
MADTTKIREEIEALDVEIRSLHQTEDGELREFTDDEQTEFDAKVAERAKKMALLERHEAIEKAAALPERTIEQKPEAPAVHVTRDAMEVAEDRTASSRQVADAAFRALEDKIEDAEYDGRRFDAAAAKAHVRSVLNRHASDREWARGIILRSSDLYASAWLKIIQHREFALTNEERTVLGVSTNANGKYLLPTHLDPTIIMTGDLSTNEIRKISRVVTLTDGSPAWNGVTSAGVTASWDGEVVEVSDDSPTFDAPSIPTVRAQALVQASISAVEDIANLGSDIMMMFAEARDNLEGAAHATGVGTTTPKGVFTAVHAVTASRVTSTTAATIGLVDLDAVYRGVPRRYRKRSTWVANPLYTLAIKDLGTAVSASFSGQLQDGTPEKILTRPVVETDDAPTTQTTTALDDEVLLGDFQQFVIVDRPGGMSVEYIPHLFNTANNLPDGRRAWYATWRNGSDVTNADAFRLLVDKTTA